MDVSRGAHFWGTWRHTVFLGSFEIKSYIKMPWKWVSLCIGAQLGNLEGIHLPGRFERK
jgi:hypothetical protein